MTISNDMNICSCGKVYVLFQDVIDCTATGHNSEMPSVDISEDNLLTVTRQRDIAVNLLGELLRHYTETNRDTVRNFLQHCREKPDDS